MDGLRIITHFADGERRELVVESDQVLIGSGAHCEVRLPVADARFEHVLVRVSPAGIHAFARAIEPPPTLNGVVFTDAPILPEQQLGVGTVRIEFAPIVLAEGESKQEIRKARSNPRPLVIAVLGIGASALIWWARPAPQDPMSEPKHVPKLWADSSPSCPQSAGSEAELVATAKWGLAQAKRERSPFQVQDGVASVPLYEVAAACFRNAGLQERAAEASDVAQEMRTRVAEEFRAHRMRLSRALAIKEWRLAERETRVLLGYLESVPGEYADWLSNLQRRIHLTYGGKKKS